MWQRPLPRLKTRNSLPYLHIPHIYIERPDLFLPARAPGEVEDIVLAVYPPFDSIEEVVIWDYLQQFDPYWIPHIDFFGGVGVPGGTNVDFVNPQQHLALYADGPTHLLPLIAARDTVLRKAVESAGLKVLAFIYRDVSDVKKHFPSWYRDFIGG